MDPASQLCDGLCFLRGLALLLAVAVVLAARRSAAPPVAQVTRVLGFDGALPSKHYVGYVTVDERHGRNLFYYLVELERDPSKDPSCSGSTAALGAQASGCILRHNRIQHLVSSTATVDEIVTGLKTSLSFRVPDKNSGKFHKNSENP